ncbi:hypothetical protein [Rhizobium sp. BK226]|uniref:hypothetical protein n=1 Tax=Rhizobium sp. BK226 TaxID=2587075 RepID=UPI001FEF8A72|nr:hypothetical protein [Rhizobium sp. BK226]
MKIVRQMDSKREKFVKLAEGRTQAALDAIRKIGNLSNRRAYEFDDGDVKKIVKALRDAASELERKFGTSGASEKDVFKL